jgi:hypothetical protein
MQLTAFLSVTGQALASLECRNIHATWLGVMCDASTDMLEGTVGFLTIVEVGATLAGFTAIVGVLASSNREYAETRLYFLMLP